MPPHHHPLLRRLYADFLMPSRLDEYRELLLAFVKADYRFETVASFGGLIRDGLLDSSRSYAILRQDVDTDVATSRAMWRIERELGVRATRYFRLQTLAPAFMGEITEWDGEASYHYEELSTLAKRCGIRRSDQLRERLPEARSRFSENLRRLREATGLPMETVAAHGDFVNRALKVSNQEILGNHEIREELGIAFEAYDRELADHVSARFCDRAVPQKWDSPDPLDAIDRRARVVCLLTHPRHWRVNLACNLADGISRVREGLAYTRGSIASP